MFLEALEERHLLAQVSVLPEITDAFESGAIGRWKIGRSAVESSDLTVNFSISSTATAGSDYQTISATSVTIPANQQYAYLDLNPLDDIWWEPTEGVTLTITSGPYTIGTPSVVTLGVVSDDVYPGPLAYLFRDPFHCNCPCSCALTSLTIGRGSGHTELKAMDQQEKLMNDSGAVSKQAVVSTKATFTQQASQATRIDVSSSVGSAVGPMGYFSGSGIQTGQEYEISIPVDVSSLPDGYHGTQMDVVEHYPSSPDITRSATGTVKVISKAGSEFGPGWLPADVDRLVEQTSGTYQGVLWIRGDYNAYWFEKNGSTYGRQAGEPDYSTLTRETNGDFTLRKKDGETMYFVDNGTYHMLSTRTDRNGNVTSYTYINSDGLDGSDEILSISQPGGLVTNFVYDPIVDPTKVTSIIDPYGRVTELQYAGGNLTTIKEPDPDGTGPLTRPTTGFTYNSDKQIASVTDAEGNATSFTYVQKLIRTVTHPGGGVETYKVAFGRALEDGLGSIGSPRPLFLLADVKTEYKNELNHTWYFTFNKFGSALTMTNPQGKVTTYEFNLENLLISITEPDPDGDPDSTYPQTEPVTTFGYDTKNNLASIDYPDGSEELWVYETNFAQVISYTNRRSKVTTFTVSATNGNTTQITQVNQGGSNNSVWDLTYTSTGIKGLLASVEDPLDFDTLYTYNSHGLLTSITYAAGTADEALEEFGYNSYDNLIWFDDGLDRRTDYTWDLLDRLTTVTLADPDGAGPLTRPVYTYEYNKNNYLKKETDPLGNVTEYGYNGRLDIVEIKQPDPDGAGSQTRPITTFAYDVHRRLTSVTDPLSHVTAYAYDSLDRNTSVTLPDPDGAGSLTSPVYSYAYDHIHRLKQITDPLSNVTLLDHSTWNRITSTLPDPDGAGGQSSPTTLDVWDAEGNFTSHTDELSRSTSYTYDDLDRLISISMPGTGLTTIGYDKSSNVTSVTLPDPDGTGPATAPVTSYEYDARNRLKKVTEADPDGAGSLTSPVWNYTYNDANELLTVTDPRGYVTTYTYDAIGRLKTVTEPDPDGGGSQTSPVTTYAYDAASQLTSVTDPLGNVTSYSYDGLGRLIGITEADPDGGGSLTSPVTSFTYDAVGNLLTVTDPLGFVTAYAYDNLDRLKQVTEADPDGGGSQTSPVTAYTYDAVNNLLTVTDPLANVTTHTFDNLYRLKTLTEPDPDGGGSQTSSVTTYGYDAAGQATSVTDALSRVTSLAYDGAGRITSVTRPDPDGAGSQTSPVTSYTYDTHSNLLTVTDPLSHVTTYEYDRLDRLTKITRPDPDGGGSQTSPLTTWAYDAMGNVTSVTDPLSRVTTYAYDGLNRRTSVTQPDPDGGGSQTSPVTSFGYDAASNIKTITDPRGNVTTRSLDNLYRTTNITQADPDGGGSLTSPVTSFAYDAAGQMLSMTDPMSRLTSYEYDGLGRNTKITEPDPDGGGSLPRPYTTMAYDKMGNLLSVTDPLNHTTSYLYDNLYRNTRITDANNGQTNFTYDKVGNLLTLDDPVGNTTTWVYDGLDRATTETNELGHSRLYVYDAAGNLTRKTDRNSRVAEYSYDNLDRNTQELWIDVPAPAPSLIVSTTTQGDTTDEVQRVGVTVMGSFIGGTFTLTYDGQTTSAIAYNATAATVQSALEALSNIGVGDVSVTKYTDTSTSQTWTVTFAGALADTNVSQITINSAGVQVSGMKTDVQQTITAGGAITYEVQTTTMSNTNGGTYTLSFEGQTTAAIAWNAAAGTVDTALEALATIDTVTVSGSSGCFSITFTGEQSGENVPQLTGNGSALENHQTRSLTFTYDAADQLTAASDPAASYAYVYDNLGRVTQQTQDPANFTPNVVLVSTYDASNNRLSLAATIGSNADFKNTYVYDNLNRMTQITQEGVGGGNAVAAKRVDFTYKADSQFDVISRYQSTGTTAPVATSHYGYDGMGRLTDLDHKTNGGATTLAAYDYVFDAASRITSVTSSIDGLSTFSYDVTNQLTAADHASQPDENYSFDLNGNRTMTGHSVGTNNRLLSDGTYNYTYDNEGNRISRTKISTGEQTLYEWDHRNRLTKVTEKNSGGTVVKTTENTYDLFDRWIRRSYDADGAGSGTATDTFFAYDGNQIVLEFDGPTNTDLSHRYLWGPQVDQFFADEQVTSLSTEGNVLWGLADHQGSLRDIADRNESSGVTTVTNHREYHAFGALTGETNSAVDLIFGYTGRLFDETTGLQDNWHRPYDAKTGGWLSEDPDGFGAGDANLRRYVNNDPTNRVDPTGLKGHHWVPQQVITLLKDLIGKEAADIFFAATLDPEFYDHANDTWLGITHSPQYNTAVFRLLQKYYDKLQACGALVEGKLTPKQAEAFLKFIKGESVTLMGLEHMEEIGTVRTWLRGFHESIAQALKLRALEANLTNEQIKEFVKRIVNKGEKIEDIDELKDAWRAWQALTAAEREARFLKYAKRALTVLAVLVVLNSARKGVACEGTLAGRMDGKPMLVRVYMQIGYDYFWGEEVEAYVFPAIGQGMDMAGWGLGLDQHPENRRRLKRNGVIFFPGDENSSIPVGPLPDKRIHP